MSHILRARQAKEKRKPWGYTITDRMYIQFYSEYFGVSERVLYSVDLIQLARCKSDSARRLLLGISR